MRIAKYHFSLLLITLGIAIQLGAFQLKAVAADNPNGKNIANIEGTEAPEKDTFAQIPQKTTHTNISHQIQGFKEGMHLWPSHRKSLAISTVSHQFRQDDEHFISCPPFTWPCFDGFLCEN